MALCGFCGCYHFLTSCTGVSYPDILIEGIKEKEAILKNKGNNVHQLFSGNIFDVDSSDPYFAFRKVMKPASEMRASTFPVVSRNESVWQGPS